MILIDADRGGNPFDGFHADFSQAIVVRESSDDGTRHDATHIVSSGDLFHPRGDIDGVAIDADRALGVALLADDHLAAMDADPEARYDAEQFLVRCALQLDGAVHRVNRPENAFLIGPGPPIPN